MQKTRTDHVSENNRCDTSAVMVASDGVNEREETKNHHVSNTVDCHCTNHIHPFLDIVAIPENRPHNGDHSQPQRHFGPHKQRTYVCHLMIRTRLAGHFAHHGTCIHLESYHQLAVAHSVVDCVYHDMLVEAEEERNRLLDHAFN